MVQMIYFFILLIRKHKEERPLKDLGVDGMIMSEQVLKETEFALVHDRVQWLTLVNLQIL